MNLIFYPDYTSTNPYQSSLYEYAKTIGYEVNVGSINDAIETLGSSPNSGTVFHIHWHNVITASAKSVYEHRLLANQFISMLTLFKSLGGTIAWTIHNKLPHDVKFLDAEIEFHQELGKVASVIFLHNRASLDVIQSCYYVDSTKVKYLAHGHYIDSYPNDVSTQESRQSLSLPDDKFIYSFVGQLRPYKGLDEFVNAAYCLDSESSFFGLIAGKPVWPFTRGKIKQICSPLRNLSVFEGFIPDQELQVYLNAADVIVLPYRDILTSGSLILATSFGKLIIIPKLDSFRSYFDMPFVFTYDPADASSLPNTIRKVNSLSQNEVDSLSKKSKEYAQSLNWQNIGRELVEHLNHANKESSQSNVIKYEDKEVPVHINYLAQTKPQTTTSIAVCVVNYFSHMELRSLVNSLKNNVKSSYQVFVLDNSVNQTEIVELNKIDGIDCIIAPEENLGYAAGNNTLIKYVKDQGYLKIAILNPDILVMDDIFPVLLKNMSDKPNSVVSPLILRNEQSVSFFTAKIEDSNTLQVNHNYDGRDRNTVPKGIFESDVLNGCAMFFDATIVDKHGYIPEHYFLYFEETDWTQRIKKGGGELLVNSELSLIHKKSTQSNGLPSLAYTYYLLRNTLIFARRHGYKISDTEAQFTSSFVLPWKENITKRCKPLTNCFVALCALAFEDGRNNVVGKVDFMLKLSKSVSANTGGAGFVDAVSNNVLSGWAVSNTTKDAKPATLLIIENDKFVKHAACSIFRKDIEELGYNSKAGFTVHLDKAIQLDAIRVIDADSLQILPVAANIDSTPKFSFTTNETTVFDKSTLRARIDGFRNGRVAGWVIDSVKTGVDIELDLYIDGEFYTSSVANKFRTDLHVKKMGDGFNGFEFLIAPSDITSAELECTVKLGGSDIVLATKKLKMEVSSNGFKLSTDLPSFLKWSYTNVLTPYGLFEKADKLQRECDFTKDALANAAKAYNKSNNVLHSIIMPAFNREDVISVALASVFEQTYGNYELLIVDDGSTDSTCKVVEQIIACNELGAKVKLIKQEVNKGVSSARNLGLAHSKGEIITYLDSDNEWDKEYLSIVNYFMGVHSKSDAAYAGQEIWFNERRTNEKFRTNIRLMPFNRTALEKSNFIDLNVFSHRASLTKELGSFRTDIRRLVDWELILRYTKNKPPVFIPALLNNYYFGFADNQITATESYADNLQKLLEGLS